MYIPDKNTILIARTQGTPITRYTYEWAGIVKDEAELLGFNVIDLKDHDFTKDTLSKAIRQDNPFFIFLNGHGKPYSVTGYDGETDIITRCENDYLFKDRIVYAFSCYTATTLGKSSYTKGCKCYIGYTDEFLIPFKDIPNVFEDIIANPFMRVSNELALTLLKGGSPEEAIEGFNSTIEELRDYWIRQPNPDSGTIIKYLEDLKKHQYMHLH